ncbi:MAG: DNA helicase PcrA [Schwartzia succinivorans]|jgi:DNA helicase-2/ATP-dependent DNA helicase PcrA|nr:DNA helicase PcrA [Schwartzia succinivorans]
MQQKAVNCLEGPLLIMAGAGSGKTKVLTYRIANLLEHNVSPYAILAITFTNKAALEMRERVNRLIGDEAKNIWLSTFHSFCARFLRFEIEAGGIYKKNFVIYDASDTKVVIKKCLKSMNLDEKHYPLASIQNAISNAKNQLMGPDAYARVYGSMNADNAKKAEIYKMYAAELRNNNALDFDDLLLLTVHILKTNDEVREKYQHRFRYILVDEYQDTNHAQYELTRLLAAGHKNLCVVGDADQSIYGWRGADITNILDFKKDYPNAEKIMLEQNYRSTKKILGAANAVIANNSNREPKNLWTQNPEGENINSYAAYNERGEADYIVGEIERYNTLYHKEYGDIAVLYRTNAQSRVLEEGFMRAGIPYTMVGGLKFYDRKEIKDIIAYLRVIFNPLDSISLLRIINEPKRGLGDTSMSRVTAFAAQCGMSVFDVISSPDALDSVDGLTGRAKNALKAFAAQVFDWLAAMEEEELPSLVEKVLDESGYIRELEKDDKPENQSRIENLKEFVSVAKDFVKSGEIPDLENFLSHISLISDIDDADTSDDRVTLMTLHSAKGLEFPIVFMAGMEDGLFPHFFKGENETADKIEEERRTCYVGITRAQQKLYLTRAKNRMIFGKTETYLPSRFLAEIPSRYLEEMEEEGGNWGYSLHRRTPSPYQPHFTSSQTGAAPTGHGMSAREALAGFGHQQAHVQRNTAPAPTGGVLRPDMSIQWKVGDKVRHSKWGIGTIVSLQGTGEEVSLKIAFPGQGIKGLMQKYAPITRA